MAGSPQRRHTARGSEPLRPSIVALAFLAVACSDAAGPTESMRQPALPITGHVAFVSTRDGSPWIYVADGTGVRRLAPGDEPAWSPDGTTIAYQSPNGISLMNADGTNVRTIRRGGSQPAWSPDGTRISFSDGGIRVMNRDGSADRMVIPNDFIQRGDAMERPDWSMDGQHIAFVRYNYDDVTAIYVVALDSAAPRTVVDETLTRGVFPHWAPAWSPDGRSLAFIHDFQLAIIGVDGRDLKFLGTRAAYESDLDWSPDGQRLLFSDYNAQRDNRSPPFTGHLRVFAATVATGEVQQLIPDVSGVVNPSYFDTHAVWSR